MCVADYFYCVMASGSLDSRLAKLLLVGNKCILKLIKDSKFRSVGFVSPLLVLFSDSSSVPNHGTVFTCGRSVNQINPVT
jgi:hypothetical protein